ncbi:hypothetical protein TNCV_4763681 [Trichonephila clavipes]|nr:hypothetical protein TNCV_4763681 [Trichonephila clavipes]
MDITLKDLPYPQKAWLPKYIPFEGSKVFIIILESIVQILETGPFTTAIDGEFEAIVGISAEELIHSHSFKKDLHYQIPMNFTGFDLILQFLRNNNDK